MADTPLIKMPGFRIIGVGAVVNNTDPGLMPIVEGLWGQYFAADLAAQLPVITPGETINLYTNYQGDWRDDYLYLVGARVPASTPAPEGLIAIDVPAQTMLVRRAKGPLPQAVVSTWQAIWADEGLDRAYVADYDVYPPGTTPADASVDVHVGVKTD